MRTARLLTLFVLASAMSAQALAPITVYITKNGSKYHQNGCRHLGNSKIAIDLSDAIKQGYSACKHCN